MLAEDLQSALPEKELWLLNRFITRFLLKSNNRRKYTHNEFSFIHSTLSGIFFRFRRVRITVNDMLFCFARSGYKIYVCNEPLHRKHKVKIGKNGLAFGFDTFIYIGISSARIIDLKKAVRSMAYQKKQSKINYLLPLKNEIQDFFKWNKKAAS